MTYNPNCNMQKSSSRTQQAKLEPLQNKASMNQPAWVSQSTFFFKEASKYTILLATPFLLVGYVSKDIYMTAVGGIVTVGGLTVVGGRKPNSQLDQENDEPYKMSPEEPQDRLDTQDATVDCLENSESQDSKNGSPLDIDSDTLTDPLDKLEQAILSGVKNC